MRTSKDFSICEWRCLRQIVYEKTGCCFKNQDVLKQAFVRSSYSARFGGENNEKLEFFGDGILDFYVRKAIADRYGYVKTNQNESFEGECEYAFRGSVRNFSEMKKEIVSNNNLARIIDDWGLAKYLIVSQSDILSKVDEEEKVKADLFEALLGAIAVQYKWNPTVLEEAVWKMLSLEDYFKDSAMFEECPMRITPDNSVSLLKEMSEQGKCAPPEYNFSGPESIGYDDNGNPKWSCSCLVKDWGISRLVFSTSKKECKKFAAYLVCCERFSKLNDYGPSKRALVWKYKDGKLLPDTGSERTGGDLW